MEQDLTDVTEHAIDHMRERAAPTSGITIPAWTESTATSGTPTRARSSRNPSGILSGPRRPLSHTPNLRSTRPRRTVFGASGMVSTIPRCASSCRSSLHNQTWSGSRCPRMTWRGPSVSRRCANDVYNPSCAHNPRWICPLAPPESRLSVPILTGELAFQDRRNKAPPFQMQIKIRVLNGVPGQHEIVVRLYPQ